MSITDSKKKKKKKMVKPDGSAVPVYSLYKFSAEHVVSPTFYFLLKDKNLTYSSHDGLIEW